MTDTEAKRFFCYEHHSPTFTITNINARTIRKFDISCYKTLFKLWEHIVDFIVVVIMFVNIVIIDIVSIVFVVFFFVVIIVAFSL